MPKSKQNGCKCRPKRYISNGVHTKGKCHDVCTNPMCGDPDTLTLLAPVVYDELGINLCRAVPIDFPTLTGTVACISAQVINVTFDTTGPMATTVTPINGRPNCYLVSLTNLTVTFVFNLYDCANRLLATETATAVYLPGSTSTPDYDYFDEDTNPNSVELEIFAPYGVASSCTYAGTPTIQFTGFNTDSNVVREGLNLIAIPKILDFDLTTRTATIGLSLYVKSIYFSQYKIPHQGKAAVPKACLQPTADTICMDFVSGDLLDLSIKPLELGPPKYEEFLKEECETPCKPCCGTLTPGTGDLAGAPPAAGNEDSGFITGAEVSEPVEAKKDGAPEDERPVE
jgi:hypothetical protein